MFDLTVLLLALTFCVLCAERGATTYVETVTLPIDHFEGSPGSFENRFWVSEEYYEPGGPVLLFDIGETSAEPYVDLKLKNASSVSGEMLAEFKAMGIVWEHRFYGDSTPYEINSTMSANQLRYLTAEQALADIPYFAGNFSRTNYPHVDLSPRSTPWLFIGGSYAGVRAAWMRDIYPDTIFAAYAASANPEVRMDASAYSELVYRALNAFGFGNCTQDVVASISFMDEAMSDPQRAPQLKEDFIGRSGRDQSNAGFARSLFAIIPGAFQFYGVEESYDNYQDGLRSFCDWMSTDPETNQTSDAEGWAKTRGAEFSVRRWSTWPLTRSLMCESCDLENPYIDVATISWMWQYCTQFGYFASANLGANQIISKYWSIEAHSSVCHLQFPDGRSSGLLPDLPHSKETNANFGGWAIRPSNVYWSMGEWDPWRVLSVFSEEDFSPNYTVTQDIPDCGVSTPEDTVFGYVGTGGLHNFDVDDQQPDDPQGKISRRHFYSAVKKWLPCFNQTDLKTSQGNDTKSTTSSTSPSGPSTASPAPNSGTMPSGSVSTALLTVLSLTVVVLLPFTIMQG